MDNNILYTKLEQKIQERKEITQKIQEIQKAKRKLTNHIAQLRHRIKLKKV